MKKSLLSLVSVLLLVSSASAQEDANVSASSQEQAKVNDGKGFYVGVGMGYSGYWATLTESSYNLSNPDGTYKVSAQSLNDNDTGYLLYAGYQFNKIVGVELAYTDYGRFSYKDVYQEPVSTALYANLGYNFLNGQLRPFGIVGLGYLQQNQSENYFNIDQDVTTAHYGIGVEYYPTVLKGLGFRAAWSSDFYLESVWGENVDTGTVAEVDLWQQYGLFYAGLQYKF